MFNKKQTRKQMMMVQGQNIRVSKTGKLNHTLYIIEQKSSNQSMVINEAEKNEMIRLLEAALADGTDDAGERLRVRRSRDLYIIESIQNPLASLVLNQAEVRLLAMMQ